MGVAGWRGGTTDLCPGRQEPSRHQCTNSIMQLQLSFSNAVLLKIIRYSRLNFKNLTINKSSKLVVFVFVCMVFNGTFSTNRLYRAIELRGI